MYPLLYKCALWDSNAKDDSVIIIRQYSPSDLEAISMNRFEKYANFRKFSRIFEF